jgi:glycerol-1-phosphatase
VLNIPIPPVFVTADMVKEGKPSPEGYLLGRERLSVSSHDHKVVVFEDAAAGVQAGKAAGALVIAVLQTHSREELAAAGADYVVDGLDRVSISSGNDGGIVLHV